MGEWLPLVVLKVEIRAMVRISWSSVSRVQTIKERKDDNGAQLWTKSFSHPNMLCETTLRTDFQWIFIFNVNAVGFIIVGKTNIRQMKNSRENSEDHVDVLKGDHPFSLLYLRWSHSTSSVNPTRCMISFCVLNICRQCLKSDRLGKTFPPQGSFKILE